MGVNTTAELVNGATAGDVLLVLMKVTGADRATWSMYGGDSGTVFAADEYALLPTWYDFTLEKDDGFVDGKNYHQVSFHWDGAHDNKTRTVHCGNSTSFWAAVVTRLVNFFGGEADYNDCDLTDVDYKSPARRLRGKHGEFDNFKQRLAAIEPLSEEEVGQYDTRGVRYTLLELLAEAR